LLGVAPRITWLKPVDGARTIECVASDEPALNLYLLSTGQLNFASGSSHFCFISSPAILLCPANTPHRLEAAHDGDLGGLFCFRVLLEGPVSALLYSQFAEPLNVPLAADDKVLTLATQLVATELHMSRCGQPALLERAGDILFICLLRHLISLPMATGGLFNGLADPRIARVLVAMHTEPQADWTLERLAEKAGMSRTAFATTFRQSMRQPPGKYLSHLRLAIAQAEIQSGHGLKRAAKASGYASTSALSRALSRTQQSSAKQN
jgi:AraC-like DNA-binding protein